MSSSNERAYTTKDFGITVIWKPDLCIHCQACVNGLPTVFKPMERPWVKVDAEEPWKIVDQVKACPSGALSIL